MPNAENILIVIDGLDECQSDREAADFLRLVLRNAQRPGRSPKLLLTFTESVRKRGPETSGMRPGHGSNN